MTRKRQGRDTQTDTQTDRHTLGNDRVELFNTQALFGDKAVRFLRSFTTPIGDKGWAWYSDGFEIMRVRAYYLR